MSMSDVCQYCLRSGRLIETGGHAPGCKYGEAKEILAEIKAGPQRWKPANDNTKPINPQDMTPTTKPTNPKDAVGVLKYAMSYVSAPVLAEIAVGMTEGGHKYGRHNYRVIGVRASIYYDATMRHLMQWWEGEDLDPDSGLSHITKAITSLVVLRDAMIQEMFTDDRPPTGARDWADDANKRTKALDAKYPNKVPSYTEVNNIK